MIKDVNDMERELSLLQEEAQQEIEKAATVAELNDVKIKYLGKKGLLTSVMKGMGKLTPEERPRIGQIVNEVRNCIEEILQQRDGSLRAAELEARIESEKIDITLPGRAAELGHLHPLTLTLDLVKGIFKNMGFAIEEGPEIEEDFYNFEALNLPPDHPARDMQDSFYITSNILLRTHTSPVQVRTMKQAEPNSPLRIIAPGKVYRCDYDATHSPMFHQVEGLVIGENISFADLKGTLEAFIHEVFGSEVGVRFRPSYFPFTEPSAEVDISCVMCGGSGCRVCSNTGWLEILGSGMVHPKVLEMGGFDPEKVTGFAFGMGIERIAMLKYGIDDLRLFYENDIRFLHQFR